MVVEKYSLKLTMLPLKVSIIVANSIVSAGSLGSSFT